MPFLFHEIVFCECGRPALPGSSECRTCYEDALRREWREGWRVESAIGTPEPVRIIKPRLRDLYAPETEEEAERAAVLTAGQPRYRPRFSGKTRP